jgi:hypothetical protein
LVPDEGLKVQPQSAGIIPPSVSSDGTTGFVVWASSDGVGYTGLYGARVGAGATVMDPVGIAIAAPIRTGLFGGGF